MFVCESEPPTKSCINMIYLSWEKLIYVLIGSSELLILGMPLKRNYLDRETVPK